MTDKYLFVSRSITLLLAGMSLTITSLFGQVQFISEQDKAVAIRFYPGNDLADAKFSIHLKNQKRSIIGQWQRDGSHFIFRPLVPFTEGEQYELRTEGQVVSDFQLPLQKSRVKLVNIFPSTDTVPENLLKIHLHFSGPMGERYSEEYIRVTNTYGDTLSQVFLPLQPELWNERSDQLTLWLDPGRIKRGLGPNLAKGQPLEKGQTYQIHISPEWRDRMGRPLAQSFSKTFHAADAQRQRPNTKSWVIDIPKSSSKESLIIDFKNPLDYILASEALSVIHEDLMVPGSVYLEPGERYWRFKPDKSWEPGFYRVKINSRLEDLAGNNLNRLFDENLEDHSRPKDLSFYHISFLIE